MIPFGYFYGGKGIHLSIDLQSCGWFNSKYVWQCLACQDVIQTHVIGYRIINGLWLSPFVAVLFLDTFIRINSFGYYSIVNACMGSQNIPFRFSLHDTGVRCMLGSVLKV